MYSLPHLHILITSFKIHYCIHSSKGCGVLAAPASEWDYKDEDKKRMKIPPYPHVIYAGQPASDKYPACPRNEKTADYVDLFAQDVEEWQRTFFDGWEKLQMNVDYELTVAPEAGNLQIHDF